MTWKKANIIIDGQKMEIPAPDIISASRSTDIPAFYADWFFHRLETGYSVWNNPFNGKKSYISYQNTRFIVFWSKNPKPLLPYLPILKERGIGCYIQFTLNDYEEDGLETGVPPLTERIETFRTLSDILGKEAVIWRFDPLILTDNISVDTLIEKIERVGTEIHNCTEKLVFSFADIDSYRKVKANMTDSGIPYHEWNKEKMEELAGKLTVLNRNRGWNLELATCGENLDLGKYRISRNRCIDGDLIARLAWKDKELMSALGVTIQEMPSPAFFDMNDLPYGAVLLPDNKYFVSNHKKDPGQRASCGCMEYQKRKNMTKEEVLQYDKKFRYMLLSRLQADCEYYLNYGNRNTKRLWAGNERKQIEYMILLHDSFKGDEKPQWLTMDEILDYQKRMTEPAA